MALASVVEQRLALQSQLPRMKIRVSYKDEAT